MFANFIIAQNIVDSTKMWRNRVVGTACNEDYWSEMYTMSIMFLGDTLINQKHYKRVINSKDEFYTNWETYLFIREDSLGKVFITSDTSQQEYLLYDFDINLGDTISVSAVMDFSYIPSYPEKTIVSNKVVVNSIDTIFMIGKNRKKIGLSAIEDGMTFYWVKGIGNITSGIITNNLGYINGLSSSEFLCYYRNDTMLYDNPDNYEWECFIEHHCSNSIKYNNEIRKNIILYPNPVANNLKLNLYNFQNKEVFIYDVYGRVVRVIANTTVIASEAKQSVQADSREQSFRYDVLNIDVSQLPKGIYFIKTGPQVAKFIKE